MTIDLHLLDAKGFSSHSNSRGIVETLDTGRWPAVTPT